MNLSFVHRWLRWGMVCALGVCLLWLISWAAVPRWVQWQINHPTTNALGRSVQVDEVLFRPWSMALTLRGLTIAQAGPASDRLEAQLRVDEVEINASLLSLFLWAPVADAIVVRNPQLVLSHRGQGRFDVDDMLTLLASSDASGSGIPRMSLFNIQVVGGVVRFRDEPLSITHSLTDLRLDIPFLSNIGGKREVVTHPRLAFNLNGSAFDTDAQTTPFAADRNTHARFQIKGLDVTPYLPYWPAAWPFQLSKGQLDVDLALDFRQQEKPEVSVSGLVAVRDVALNERFNRTDLPLFRCTTLHLEIGSWRPLDAVVNVSALNLDQPVVFIRRNTVGELNTARLQKFFSTSALEKTHSTKPDALLSLKHFEIKGGRLNWQDAATQQPVNLSLSDLDFQAEALSWPIRQVASLEGKAQLAGASLSWSGTTDLTNVQVRVMSRGLALGTAAPYWAHLFRPGLTGQLTADVKLDWFAAEGSKPSSLVLASNQIRVSDGVVGANDAPDLAWSEMVLDQVNIDVFQQKASVGRVGLTRPVALISRNAKGRWMVEDWQVDTQPAASTNLVSSSWDTVIGSMQITDGTVSLDDRWMAGGVLFHVRDLNVLTGAWQPLALPLQSTPIQLQFSTGSERREAGQLNLKGFFRWPLTSSRAGPQAPLQLTGQLTLTRFPLHRLRTYVADRVNFDLRRADVSYAGGLDLTWPAQGLDLDAKGQLTVENFRAFNPADGQALLDIETLNLSGLNVAVRGGALQHLKVSETALRDFFALVAIDGQGHLNLQSMLKADPSTDGPDVKVAPLIELGPLGVVNGRVLFSDHFIRPHYSADITNLSGSLGALSNRSRVDLAEISLRGRVAGSGTLEVTGHINPLTRPVGLDVHGQVSDLELPQLSPYSSKYAGYGIERGKLSAQVDYRIGAEGQLTATHQLTLKQLRFGERSDRTDAPNLPVKLAVALLANRNGVIDLNLPVSGSINDPDFRVGPTVWRMVLNLIGKAVLSPFSLLSGVFSGEDQLQQIDFLPGQADLSVAAVQKLEAVAKLVIDKPIVHLTVVGHADLDTEREAWRRFKLHETLRAEKRRQQLRLPQAASPNAELSQEEYPALLQEVYQRSTLPKPRNAWGLVKQLPVADMEALLLAAIAVQDSDMRELAQARAQHVRTTLLALNVPEEQLFLGAPIASFAPGVTPFVPKVLLVVSTD